MGKVSISGAGGVGAGSDECTATKAELLKGYTAITGDSDDEVVDGTLELIGDAADSQVLIGKTYYNKDAKVMRTGTMPNRGAVSTMLNAGDNYIVPSGYHNGTGKIAVNSLASQTPATASANKIVSGYSAYVNGVKIDGTLTIQSVVSFSLAQYATQQIIASWARPNVGPWSGLRVVCKLGSYPANADDGTIFYDGSGTYGLQTLAVGTWYFRSWNYITTNLGREYGGYVQGIINNSAITGSQTFTASGVFTVPASVRSVNVFAVGGGASSKYDGGGGGRTVTWWNISVSPGQQISVIVGSGGSGFGPGGASSFGGYSIPGGSGSVGGSGGGNCGRSYSSGRTYGNGGRGGTNGESGENTETGYNDRGNGQGYTTKPFNDPNGTPYAGGGGGTIGRRSGSWKSGNGGGDGGYAGGGNGNSNTPYDQYGSHSAGAPNTGGGSGGAGEYEYNDDHDTTMQTAKNGGSGIVIVRWGY